MKVDHDDLVHFDQHGGVVIPMNFAPDIIDAARECQRREAPILALARGRDFSVGKLADLLQETETAH